MSEPNAPARDTDSTGANGANPDSVTPVTLPAQELQTLLARSQERDQFFELLKRTQADFDNFQKRNQREREQERLYVHRALALDLLPALDNLERALEDAQRADDRGPLAQGVGMVHTQLMDMFKRHGVSPIESAGKTFDPNLHQAVMREPATEEHPPNTIVRVLERGYMIHDRVLRPARVIVAMSAE